ncbi:hypothetical protein QJQ45_014464 [Haematococcus lacustris]|nr:hypothetical protein QJQ45_014464 [Haematococcus lacustris]
MMDATYTPQFASVLHSIHSVMTGAGARLVDVKCGRPIQVQEFEEFRFNTFEVAMVCMNALRRVHPTPPGSGSMWNSSGKKVIAQGLVTADWATLAAAIQQAKVTEDGTEASPTKLIQQGTEASSELALSKGHIELDAAQGRAVQAMPLSPSLSRAIHLTEIVVDWCKAVRSGPTWQHIGPVLTAIMAVDPAPKVSVYR